MNTEKIAFNKVAKIKTDLALIDDLKKIQKESTNAYVEYIDDMDTSKSYLQFAIKKATKATQLLKESVRLYDDVEVKFKELGIDIPSELKNQTPTPALQEAEKDLAMMKTIFSQFKVR